MSTQLPEAMSYVRVPKNQELTLAVARQERLKKLEEWIERDGYTVQVLPGAKKELSAEFLDQAFEYGLKHGQLIKDEPENEEVIWKFPGQQGQFVMKRIQVGKKGVTDIEFEMRMLQRARLLDLPAPEPLGIMRFHNDGPAFLLMKFVEGISGVDLYDKLSALGNDPKNVERKLDEICHRLQKLAETFRKKMNVDKRWYVKDCLIELTDDGEVNGVFPLDWERAHEFDPSKPEAVDTLAIILSRRERHAGRAAA